MIASADHLHAPREPPNLESFTQEEAGPGHGKGYPIILQSDKALGWWMTLPVPSLYWWVSQMLLGWQVKPALFACGVFPMVPCELFWPHTSHQKNHSRLKLSPLFSPRPVPSPSSPCTQTRASFFTSSRSEGSDTQSLVRGGKVGGKRAT